MQQEYKRFEEVSRTTAAELTLCWRSRTTAAELALYRSVL